MFQQRPSYYGIHKYDYTITYGYTAEHDMGRYLSLQRYHRSVRELKDEDVIPVKSWKAMEIYGWSCLTIVELQLKNMIFSELNISILY